MFNTNSFRFFYILHPPNPIYPTSFTSLTFIHSFHPSTQTTIIIHNYVATISNSEKKFFLFVFIPRSSTCEIQGVQFECQ